MIYVYYMYVYDFGVYNILSKNNYTPGTETGSAFKFFVPGTRPDLYQVPKFGIGPGPG